MAACIHCNGRGCTNCQKLDSAAHLRVMRDDARRERGEARAEAAKRHDAFNAQLAQRLSDLMLLQAENAALKARNEVLTQANDELGPLATKLKGGLALSDDYGFNTYEMLERFKAENATLRARLERAEAVCEAAVEVEKARVAPRGLAGFQVLPLVMHHLREALTKWREGRG